MSERKGVEIDYCPQCRGVWLDRGEIDKIIERSLSEQEKTIQQTPSKTASFPPTHTEQYGHKYGHQERYKKKSIWHEIFD
jgi:Zn-finger nucleic acid-binding protein